MQFQIFSRPEEIYSRMLKDISGAKSSIYLETYIYDNDSVGSRFRELLIKKAKQGVKIKLLLDAWGSGADKNYFKNLIKLGAEVKFFRELRYVIKIFTKNHERNHRKLLLIDEKISYIGSANITKSCLKWRELVIRLQGPITEHFISSFNNSWNLSGKLNAKKIGSMIHSGYTIVQDLPSSLRRKRPSERKYIHLINGAKEKIKIETPYFVPSIRVRRALRRAAKRGVKITLILPEKSNHLLPDLIRNRYLGKLLKKRIKIFYFKPGLLHSKLLIIDDKFFLLGSSNLDYRSLKHQYEINLIGQDKKMILELKRYFYETLSKSRELKYDEWKNRSSFTRFLEVISSSIRKYV